MFVVYIAVIEHSQVVQSFYGKKGSTGNKLQENVSQLLPIQKKCALQHTKSPKESLDAKALKISKPLLL